MDVYDPYYFTLIVHSHDHHFVLYPKKIFYHTLLSKYGIYRCNIFCIHSGLSLVLVNLGIHANICSTVKLNDGVVM